MFIQVLVWHRNVIKKNIISTYQHNLNVTCRRPVVYVPASVCVCVCVAAVSRVDGLGWYRRVSRVAGFEWYRRTGLSTRMTTMTPQMIHLGVEEFFGLSSTYLIKKSLFRGLTPLRECPTKWTMNCNVATFDINCLRPLFWHIISKY